LRTFSYHHSDLLLARALATSTAILRTALSGPLIYLTTSDKYTLQLGLMAFKGQYITDIPATMAASVMILLPIILIFLFGQQYSIRSVVLSGLKG